MYDRSDVRDFFKLVNAGLLDLSVCEVTGEFGLEEFKEAWDVAAERAGFAKTVLIRP